MIQRRSNRSGAFAKMAFCARVQVIFSILGCARAPPHTPPGGAPNPKFGGPSVVRAHKSVRAQVNLEGCQNGRIRLSTQQ